MSTKKRLLRYFGILFFILAFLITRLPRLQNDIFSTDAVYWHNRSKNFIEALQSKDYAKTYQMYHPGVTLMWTTGLTAKAVSQFNNLDTDFIFSNARDFHYLAKLTLVLWQLGLALVAIYLLSQIFNYEKALFMVLLLSVEPFFVGNSRLLHLDAQIAFYFLIGLSLSYLSIKKENLLYPILAGVFFGLGALSKSIALGGLAFGATVPAVLLAFNKKYIKGIKHFGLVMMSFAITYFGLFPALWVDAKWVLDEMFNRSFEVGEIKGHEQIFMGEVTHDPGFWFYPTLFFLKLSLVTIVGFLAYYFGGLADAVTKGFGKVSLKKVFEYIKDIPFTVYVTVFYLGYFIVISYFDKKVDRYPIPLYPFFTMIAVLGFYWFSKKLRWITLAFTSLTLVFTLFRSFPHYMTYTNPLIGDAEDGNIIVGQKLFGIGVYDLRQHIIDTYGDTHEIAINDYGPMKKIYDWETFNIFVEHPNSYDYAILGPNKDIPPSIKKSGVEFKYDSSVYINGLEFWRVFVKKD